MLSCDAHIRCRFSGCDASVEHRFVIGGSLFELVDVIDGVLTSVLYSRPNY
jgi:hypothetical protein